MTVYRVDADTFTAELVGGCVDVYREAMRGTAQDTERRRGLFVRHTLEPGWTAVAAGTPPVGFAYGFHCAPGQWWYDTLRDGLRRRRGRQVVQAWLRDVFCVAELHVRPSAQRQGLGAALMAALLDGRREQHVVLSTPDDAAGARAFYARLGFTELATGFVFPGTPTPYTVLARELT
ncbi:MAG: GNAT family N-acetyltransferase [Streptosporangiales bacterium]|nr:GNAT family N-acetyltransferase [Streptosporangiales bacterium]